MKLILKDYLRTLKEKDELDLLIGDLLLLAGYETHNKPKTGERQYGVDIIATKENQVYLFVIKQQDITRSVWDSGPDSVRQSLNDIFDVYINMMMPETLRCMPINIIVSSNGALTDAVRPNWSGYVNTHMNYNGNSYEFDFWDIDKLVNLVYQLMFNENMFPEEMKGILRKVLYFIDEDDFNNIYYEKIIDNYINQLISDSNKDKKFVKYANSFNLCIHLIIEWSFNSKKYKLGIRILEYTIIKYWLFLKKSNKFESIKHVTYLNTFVELYEKTNDNYFAEMQKIASFKNGIPFYNSIERRILLYEIIALLSSYGTFLIYKAIGSLNNKKVKEKIQNVCNVIIQIVNNNDDFAYPVFDNNIVEISILFSFLMKLDRTEDVKNLLHYLIFGMKVNFYRNHKQPAPTDNYSEAVYIDINGELTRYEVSILFGELIDWTCIVKDEQLYEGLLEFLRESFKNTTCQVWRINENEEDALYNKNAVYLAGTGVVYDISKSYKEHIDIVKKINENISYDNFSFFLYSFPQLSIMISEYFHYPLTLQTFAMINKI